jgi:hypothetical protein
MGVGGIWKGFTQQEWFYLPIDRITIFVWKGGCHGTRFDPEIGETTQGLGQHPNCSFFPFTSSTVDQSPHISTISLDSNIVHINQLITCHKFVINQPEIIISDHFCYVATKQFQSDLGDLAWLAANSRLPSSSYNSRTNCNFQRIGWRENGNRKPWFLLPYIYNIYIYIIHIEYIISLYIIYTMGVLQHFPASAPGTLVTRGSTTAQMSATCACWEESHR